MKKVLSIISSILQLMTLLVIGGCGSGNKGGAESPVAPATKIGSESCVNTCHAQTVDITGTSFPRYGQVPPIRPTAMFSAKTVTVQLAYTGA